MAATTERDMDIDERIRGIDASIKNLTELLPYADHGAYGQDKNRISQLKQERARLVEEQRKAEG